uniref:Polyribonucleotide nucleotidyltransferase (PNPase)) n=1 Tax=Ganoderma boninense TaxID=34458 RepID=A0A5K1JV89_9APHY|nr:Polyribonucleotide nucleotidyltransferase (EC (Polynucleotide phosphorylase) (PNPase) [Ganoderma boninense]
MSFRTPPSLMHGVRGMGTCSLRVAEVLLARAHIYPVSAPQLRHIKLRTRVKGFDTLLSFMYTARIYDPASISLPDWLSLLRISTPLQFPRVCACAIRHLSARLSALAPVDAILLAREHDIPAWLGPAYAELVHHARVTIPSGRLPVSPSR